MNPLPFSSEQLVLDTSVVIKWYRQGEVLAPKALVLRDLYLTGQTTILIPSLLVYELTNVLRYKSSLSNNQVQEAIQSLFEMNLEIVSPSSQVMQQAVEIARAYDTTVYDATFAALAQDLLALFVTADARLVQSLSDLSFVHSLDEIVV